MTDEAREAAWATFVRTSGWTVSAGDGFDSGFDAGVAEGIRRAREAVANAEDVTFHKWLPEGEDYPSVVIHDEDHVKAIVFAAIDALGVNT